LPIQPQKCIGKYVTSHAKTFLTVSVRTADHERMASGQACEQAPSEGGKESGGGTYKAKDQKAWL